MESLKKSVIIVAGGIGNRMQSEVPKQFLLLKNKPILCHTIEKFNSFDASISIVLVLPENQFEYWKELCKNHNFTINHQLVKGGETRFKSVKNGLDLIQDGQLVAIHDGVRPLVSEKVIKNCFQKAEDFGASIPVISINESIRSLSNDGSRIINRDEIMLVQTPQVFKSSIIKKAYNQEFQESFTDDASVLESDGGSVKLVEGNRENIKITRALDLKIAEAILESR